MGEIRQVCVYCKRVLSIQEDKNYSGDSGEICPGCLKIHHPEVFEHLKKKNFFSSEQLREADNSVCQ